MKLYEPYKYNKDVFQKRTPPPNTETEPKKYINRGTLTIMYANSVLLWGEFWGGKTTNSVFKQLTQE